MTLRLSGIIPQPAPQKIAESEAMTPVRATEVETLVNRLRSGGADYLPVGYAHSAANMIERLYAQLLSADKKKQKMVTIWQGHSYGNPMLGEDNGIK